MLLHPRDVGYTVDDVRALVEGSGLTFQRWMGQGQYSPDVSPLLGVGLGNDVGALDAWGQAAVMELFYGVIIKHEFIVRPGSDATPATLFATDEAVLDAYPRLSPYLRVDRDGEQMSLVNRAHQVAIRVGGPVSLLAPILAEFDGKRTTLELLQAEGAGSSQTVLSDRAALVRQLYVADAVQLSLHPTPA